MTKTTWNTRLTVITGIILAGAFMRLIPHWPNFTPIAAMALFGGAYMGRKYLAYAVPFATMFISDLIIGFHDSMLAVYLAFGITVTIGIALSRRISMRNILGASLASSVIFFMITNFASWLSSPFLYSSEWTGLMQSYVAGLAFFNDGSYGISFFLNEVAGSLFFNALFFGAFYFARLRFPVLGRA